MTVKWMSGVSFCAGLFLLLPGSKANTIFVTNDYPTIQAAIDAAAPGDVIYLDAGKYPAILTINKSLSLIGSGTNNCVIYNCTNIPLISITGPATVTLSNFQLTGGWYQAWHTNSDWYSGFSNRGIVATNANLT